MRALATAVVAAAALCTAGVATVAAPRTAVPATDQQPGGTAQAWSTTPDRANLLRLVGTYGVGQKLSVASGATIDVDLTSRGQSITGFGAALTHSSARLLAGLPASERRRVLTELFSPSGPVRLSVVRIPLGASDFIQESAYTYDDLPTGSTDWNLAKFSTAKDGWQLRPVLREIRAINPAVVIVAAPWSAPAWMKSSGSLNGGRLKDDPRAVPTYVQYLLRALIEYKAMGVSIDYLSVQNEPQTRWPADYPRMEMPAAQQVAVIEALGPAISRAGLATKILAFDHNWSQHPADRSAVPPGGDAEDDYAVRVLGSPAGRWVSGTAFHCYSGDASAHEAVRAAAPAASIWVTECSGTRSANDASTFADTLYWHSRSLLIPSLDHWATSVLTWNLALDPSGGPHRGGCTTCTPVVTVANGRAVPASDYYVLAHAARFVPRGSVRVGSTIDNGTFEQVAFRAPDGSVVVLLHQSGWLARSVTVRVSGASYQVPVSPWSLTTIRIRPA